MNLRYAIIGTGALGGFYGGKLAQSGCNVHFLLNSDYEYVKTNGLQVNSTKGDFLVKPVHAYHSENDMPACDVVLVCLKTTANNLLKDLLPPLIQKDTMVVLIQNGLGIEREVAADFPDLNIAGGLAFICSEKTGPGQIAHYDLGNIKIGAFRGDCTGRIEQVCSDFNNAGVPAEPSNDLNRARWEKLVWNIPYNGLTVVLNTTTDNLMSHPGSRQLVWELMSEVVTAARHCGAATDIEFAHKMMHLTDKMKPYAPSMKVDYDAGRPMEIQSIYTNPIQTARKAGYEMNKAAMLEVQLRFLQNSR